MTVWSMQILEFLSWRFGVKDFVNEFCLFDVFEVRDMANRIEKNASSCIHMQIIFKVSSEGI